MKRPPAVDGADFVPDDEFDVDEFFPFAPVQQWAALCDRITAEQLAVLTFTMCHLNPLTGRFDAKFGRGRVAERFGKSLDWVDKQFKGLVAAGAMTKQHMYWLDAKNRGAHGLRSPEPVDPETGAKRAQASNRWRVRMKPPGAGAYPGPVTIREFYAPSKITDRLCALGGAAEERLPREQGKRNTSAGQRGAAAQRLGGAAEERPAGAAVQRPELSLKGTITDPSVRTRADAPREDPRDAPRDGRTEDSSRAEPADQSQRTPDPDPAAGVSTAAALVAAEAIQADLRRIDLLPATKPHQQQQLGQLLGAIDKTLIRFPKAKVARYLADKAAAANTVKFLLTAFTVYDDAIRDVQVPALDDLHDTLHDTEILRAVAEAGSSTTPTAPEVLDVPEPDLSSPVPWLTDAQFAALSFQDRAHVRVAAEIPTEQLRPLAASRVRAIRRAAEEVPA